MQVFYLIEHLTPPKRSRRQTPKRKEGSSWVAMRTKDSIRLPKAPGGGRGEKKSKGAKFSSQRENKYPLGHRKG